jgi:hypothetical protein
MTSNFIGEPGEVRRVAVLIGRVCAIRVASAAFALRSPAC